MTPEKAKKFAYALHNQYITWAMVRQILCMSKNLYADMEAINRALSTRAWQSPDKAMWVRRVR
jgi:hypothetical protein